MSPISIAQFPNRWQINIGKILDLFGGAFYTVLGCTHSKHHARKNGAEKLKLQMSTLSSDELREHLHFHLLSTILSILTIHVTYLRRNATAGSRSTGTRTSSRLLIDEFQRIWVPRDTMFGATVGASSKSTFGTTSNFSLSSDRRGHLNQISFFDFRQVFVLSSRELSQRKRKKKIGYEKNRTKNYYQPWRHLIWVDHLAPNMIGFF